MYLFLAYSQANQTNALYGLATQQPKLFLHSILHYVLKWWHEQVVVRHKLLLRRVSHWGNGCHHLLQDKFGALLDQLEREEDTCNSGWAILPPPPPKSTDEIRYLHFMLNVNILLNTRTGWYTDIFCGWKIFGFSNVRHRGQIWATGSQEDIMLLAKCYSCQTLI